MDLLLPSAYRHNFNQTYEFYMTDSEDLWKKNCAQFGPRWHWYDKKIVYKFNALGYRMNKNLDQVDLDNYILFLGCSNTVGVGMPLEQTFAYMISQKLDCDYINAAVGGGSPDFVYYNFSKLMSQAPRLPWAVVVNWPEMYRTMYWENDHENTSKEIITFFGPNFSTPDIVPKIHSSWISAYREFLRNTQHVQNRFDFIRKTIQFICGINGIPLYECTNSKVNKHYESHRIPCFMESLTSDMSIYDHPAVLARDVGSRGDSNLYSHPGPNTHIQMTDAVLEFLDSGF